eukprot:349632-Chlamydomonas_euryale.AAC.12
MAFLETRKSGTRAAQRGRSAQADPACQVWICHHGWLDLQQHAHGLHDQLDSIRWVLEGLHMVRIHGIVKNAQ